MTRDEINTKYADYPTYLYVLELKGGSLYVGVTYNLEQRLRDHM